MIDRKGKTRPSSPLSCGKRGRPRLKHDSPVHDFIDHRAGGRSDERDEPTRRILRCVILDDFDDSGKVRDHRL